MERELSKLNPNAPVCRPALIKPSHHSEKRAPIARLVISIAAIADRVTENAGVDRAQVARCMLEIARNGAAQHIVDN